MDITRKFQNPTLSAIADLHVGLTFHVRSISSPISMNLLTFRKMPLLQYLKKMQKMFHRHFLYQFS